MPTTRLTSLIYFTSSCWPLPFLLICPCSRPGLVRSSSNRRRKEHSPNSRALQARPKLVQVRSGQVRSGESSQNIHRSRFSVSLPKATTSWPITPVFPPTHGPIFGLLVSSRSLVKPLRPSRRHQSRWCSWLSCSLGPCPQPRPSFSLL